MHNIINNSKYNIYIIKTTETKPTFTQNNKRFKVLNASRVDVYKMTIDGGIIKIGERCDYGLFVESTDTLFLIELKGCEIDKAYSQLYSTYKWFRDKVDDISCYDIKVRVVCSKVPRLIRIEKFRKLFRQNGVFDVASPKENEMSSDVV